MKTHLYLSSLLLFLSTVIFSQNRLSIYYPLWWNEYLGEGTIEEATFTLKPQGIFVEVGMYFTFSFPENNFGIEDSLEIVFDFNLPEEAIVNDSWLWVGDQIVRAEIAEIWTAIQTYEEIVNRQQDPSVLFEKPDGGHQLRIFPLVEQQTRRVKINYLLPARWTPEELSVKLPTEFFEVSENVTSDFRLLVFPDAAWGENYRIPEYPYWEFQPVTDPEFGPCLELQVPYGNASHTLHLVMDSPLTPDGLFVGRYTGEQENFYHLVYFPDSSLTAGESTRVMAVLYYIPGSSDLTKQEVIQILKNGLKERLSGQDFFNLALCNDSAISLASPDEWLPADDATIDSVFDNIPLYQVPIGKPLLDILLAAGDFIMNAAQGGEMLLVSNTDQYGDGWFQEADDAIAVFTDHFSGAFPVHICDFQTEYYETWWNDCDDWLPNTLCYKGNEYFSYQLAAQTGGSFFDMLGNGADLVTNLNTQLNTIGGQSAIYELYTDMNAGLCYQRYPVTYLGQSRYLHLPILQVGKYVGEFPMTVEFFAISNGQIFSEAFVVEEDQVVELDTLAEESWVGNHLRMLEANDNLVFEAIDLSIHHRVLSEYTAFIALDPALGGEPCFDCLVGGGPVIIETTELPVEDEKRLSAFPNPFHDGIAIQLTGVTAADVRIYDQMGRLVRILEAADSLWWDGKNAQRQDLPAGVFIVVVTSEKGDVYSLKINKI